MRLLLCILLCALVACMPAYAADPGAPDVGLSVVLEAKAAMRRGAAFLRESQLPNGSWTNHPVITSLAAVALANMPGDDEASRLAELDSALDYIAGQAHTSGAIWNRQTRQYPLYSTAMSMLALIRAGRSEDVETLKAARKYLKAAQQDAQPEAPEYGGFAVRDGVPPSLTVSQWGLEALYLTDYLEEDEASAISVYRKALVFIQRCQVLTNANGGDPGSGCFRDFPGMDEKTEFKPKPGMPRSTAFLTCIGVKSLIYARSPQDSPGVQGALRCLRRFYAVNENPGLGEKGLYTYLFALSKALRSLDRHVLVDAEGTRHFWRQELVLELLGRQKGNGSWRQAESAWWENHPELVTAYAVMILERALAPELAR